MTSLAVLCAGMLAIWGSKRLFGSWFNHVAVYTGIWTVSVASMQLRLIEYYPLTPETWVVILAGWGSFVLGAVAVVAARFAAGQENATVEAPRPATEDEVRILRNVLWLLSIVSAVVVVQHWVMLLRKFGSIGQVLIWGNLVYSHRVQKGIEGGIPYVDSLAIAACLFGGLYMALTGRLRSVALLPFVIVFVNEIAAMGRAKLVMAGALYVCGYAFGRFRVGMSTTAARGGKLKRLGLVVVTLGLLITGAEFVRSTRGSTEQFVGGTTQLYKLGGSAFLTPSIYMYASSQPAVLNQYLKGPGEDSPWGANTFAPIHRVLAKLGFDIRTEVYQRFYVTPVYTNTGTYLRELHADFGIPGILLGPFVLGLVTSLVWFRARRGYRYTTLVLLGYLFTLVAMSILYMATRAGDLLSAIVGALATAWYLEHREKTRGDALTARRAAADV
jgi:oligosaccharide repeat unit polymerase